MSNHQKYPELKNFRMWLKEQGVFPQKARYLLRGAAEFNRLGMEKDLSKIPEYKEYLLKNGTTERKACDYVKGAEYYIRFLSGEASILGKEHFACDRDCFNCPFPDCVMP